VHILPYFLAGPKAGAVAQVFDRACRGLSRSRALGQAMRQGQGSVARPGCLLA